MKPNGSRSPTHAVVTYHTTTAALHSQQILEAAGYAVRVIDVPRSLSTDCCQGLLVLWKDREAIAHKLEGAGVTYLAVLPWPG